MAKQMRFHPDAVYAIDCEGILAPTLKSQLCFVALGPFHFFSSIWLIDGVTELTLIVHHVYWASMCLSHLHVG